MRPTSILLLFSFVTIIVFNQKALAQCIVLSNNGYQVEISLEPVQLVVPSNCPWGYGYNVAINYSINIVGQNAPASLYTLQGHIRCGDHQLFFQLPNAGGTGQTTTTSNPWNGNSDCATATLNSLDCRDFRVQIHGLGIPDQIVQCNMSPLPIELVAFRAVERNNVVQFNWITASETNNDYFSVERSSNGRDWVAVARIDGAGNSSTILNYEAVDPAPLQGVSYYRLKQTDFNGEFSYSEIEAVSVSSLEAIELRVFPNPTDGQVTIAASAEGKAEVGVFDLLGNEISNRVALEQKGGRNHSADLSGLPSGAYIIRANGSAARVLKN